MILSSRTPEGRRNNCPICGQLVTIMPLPKLYAGHCPHCDNLLWFTEHGLIPVFDLLTDFDQLQSVHMHNAIDIPDYVLNLVPKLIVHENCVIPIDGAQNGRLVGRTSINFGVRCYRMLT